MARDSKRARITLVSHTPDATFRLGRSVGKHLKAGQILTLQGDLGAGKTTFVKGLISPYYSDTVTSPTFTYLESYPKVHHFDLYRIKSLDAFRALGFEELLADDSICCIEWPEKIASILPEDVISIQINYLDEGSREILINNFDMQYAPILSECQVS